nr:Acetyltransferase (GNAT) domain protein [uncultured bacterium]
MLKQLPDGLILRSLSENIASDVERLPDFYASINAADDTDDIKEGVRVWTRDLMHGHATVTLDDIFVVVDPAKDDLLVSATLLIPQTWRYEDVVIPVGRPELVATHPDYRNRRLVRALFDALHERSAALGHNLQVITGIAHFYRQFGYTMSLDRHGVHFLTAYVAGV